METKKPWKYNGINVNSVALDVDNDEYILSLENGNTVHVSHINYVEGHAISDYNKVGELIGDKPEGIRWTDGICYRCRAEVDPYDTGCPRCHCSFVD